MNDSGGNKLNFNSLWMECEALYPARKETCLALQDKHGVNVNLLLLALYLDKQTCIRYSQKQWQQLLASIEGLEQLIKPYRELRQASKTIVEPDKYKKMLDVELMMERESQNLISDQLKGMSGVSHQSNLRSFLGIFGITSVESGIQ